LTEIIAAKFIVQTILVQPVVVVEHYLLKVTITVTHSQEVLPVLAVKDNTKAVTDYLVDV
jgi:hypothetical protein